MIQSLLMGMIKHSQSTQNKKFALSLPYLKKEVRVELSSLFACRSWHYRFWWKWRDMSKLPKYKVGKFFAICLEKRVYFCK